MNENYNQVNELNFNATLYGYLIRACKIGKLTAEEELKIFMGMRWALDEATMEDARETYKKEY